MNKAYLVAKIEKLQNAIAFNVSCPAMLPYQRAMLAAAEAKLAAVVS